MTASPAADPSAEPAALLELRGVTAAYGRIQVLHGVDLAVPQKLSSDARDALKHFADATKDHDPRADLMARAKDGGAR